MTGERARHDAPGSTPPDDGPAGRPGARAPRLSVAVVAHDHYGSIRLVVTHLAEQTMAGAMEVLIAAPSGARLGLVESDMARFHGHRVVEVGEVVSRGRAAARAVREARGDVVALIENHSFPDPGWAEALLDAHQGPWAAVGPVVENANPGTAWSRAMHLFTYGRWTAHVEPREMDGLPWHNTAYERAALEAFGDELDALFEVEQRLQDRLRDDGHRLFLEPRARTRHISDSRPRTALQTAFNHGRLFAAARARDWSWPRRLGYVIAAPVFPLRQLAHLRPEIRRIRRRDPVLDLVPLLLLILAVVATGECAGFLFGEGDCRDALLAHELDTDGRIRAAERAALQERLAARPAARG